MRPEEAVAGTAIAIKGIPLSQHATHPRRMMLLILQSMTVKAIIHDLPVTDPLLVVNLPEDDAALPRGPQPIAARRTHHLFPRQIPRGDYRLTELAPDRQALSPKPLRRMSSLRFDNRFE